MLTVKEIREAIDGLPDDMQVFIQTQAWNDDCDQVALQIYEEHPGALGMTHVVPDGCDSVLVISANDH